MAIKNYGVTVQIALTVALGFALMQLWIKLSELLNAFFQPAILTYEATEPLAGLAIGLFMGFSTVAVTVILAAVGCLIIWYD